MKIDHDLQWYPYLFFFLSFFLGGRGCQIVVIFGAAVIVRALVWAFPKIRDPLFTPKMSSILVFGRGLNYALEGLNSGPIEEWQMVRVELALSP